MAQEAEERQKEGNCLRVHVSSCACNSLEGQWLYLLAVAWICWQWLDLLSSVCHRGATEWTLEPNPQLQVEWGRAAAASHRLGTLRTVGILPVLA
jgi:hypothetical protein